MLCIRLHDLSGSFQILFCDLSWNLLRNANYDLGFPHAYNLIAIQTGSKYLLSALAIQPRQIYDFQAPVRDSASDTKVVVLKECHLILTSILDTRAFTHAHVLLHRCMHLHGHLPTIYIYNTKILFDLLM